MKRSVALWMGLVLLAACAVATIALSPQGPQASAPVGAPQDTAQPPSPAPGGDIQVPAEELLDLWADRADFGGLFGGQCGGGRLLPGAQARGSLPGGDLSAPEVGGRQGLSHRLHV